MKISGKTDHCPTSSVFSYNINFQAHYIFTKQIESNITVKYRLFMPVQRLTVASMHGHNKFVVWQSRLDLCKQHRGFAFKMEEADPDDKRTDDDLHLRSTKEIMGYPIHSVDGDYGYVSDFILDDANWQFKYLVVYAHEWFGGKKVLLKTGAIKEIQWEISKAIVNISTDAIKACTVFDEA